MTPRFAKCALLFLLATAGFTPARAATVQWTNASGGNWSVGSNWSGGVAPSSGDDVVISTAGTYSVTVDVTATVNSLSIGGASGTQTLSIVSPTLTVTNGGSIGAQGVLSLNGGVITASSGTFTNNGTFQWQGGTINGGATIVNNAAFNITGSSVKYFYQATLNNNATVVSNSTTYTYLYNSPVVNNASGATWDIQSDAGYYVGSGTPVFNNSGTLKKSGGTSTKDFYFVLNNSGQVQVQSGGLRLGNGGTSSGPFTLSANSTLAFNGGTHQLNAGATLTGGGSVSVANGTVNVADTYDVATATTLTGGTLNLTGTVNAIGTLSVSSWGTFNLNTNNTVTSLGTVELSNGTISLNSTSAFTMTGFNFSGGTFSGTAAVTITGTFAWSGGVVNRTGSITLPSGSAFNLTGGTKYWYAATLNNSGTVTSASNSQDYFYNGAVINNLAGGSWTLQSNTGYGYGGGTLAQFNNAGTFTRTTGTGTSDIWLTFNNGGTMNVNSGTLRLGGGGTSSSPYNVAAGAALHFVGGTHALSASAPITGAGSVTVTNGSVAVSGNYDISAGTTVSGGALTLTGTLTATGPVTISGGTFDVSVPAAFSFNTLSLSNGTLAGTTALTITTFNWSGGTVNRTGSISIPAAGTLDITGSSKLWYSATLNNSGTVNSGSSYYLYLYNGAVLNNLAGANWNITTDWGYYHAGGALPAINNAGTLTKSGGTGIKDISVAFNNSGSVSIDSGTLRLGTGGTHSGPFYVGSGATLQFAGSAHALSAAAPVSGAGSLSVSSGSVTVAGNLDVTGGTVVSGGSLTLGGTLTNSGAVTLSGGTFDISVAAAFNLASLNVSGGTLAGSTALTVTTFAWSGGSINRAGAISIPASTGTMSITGSTKYWQQATLNNSGAVTSNSTYYAYFYNGAVINNLAGATWNIQSDYGYAHGGGTLPQFNNAGTFTRSAGSGNFDISLAFNNSGTVHVNSGALRFGNGGSSSGAFNVGSVAALHFYGGTHSLTATAPIGGAGSVTVSSGSVAVAGDYNITNGTTISGGTLTLSGTLTSTGAVTISSGTFDVSVAAAFNLASLTLSGGTLAGSTALTITTFNWSGGFVNRSGAIDILAAGTFNITGSTKYWYQATLNNGGTLTSSSSYYLYVYNGAVLNNLAGAAWNMTTDWGYYHGGGAMPQINNAGTMTKSAGSGIKDIGIAFHNSGQVNVNSGTLRLGNGGTSSGTFNVASGAALHFNSGTHTLTAASTLAGAGAISMTGGTATVAGTYNITGGTSSTSGTLTLTGTLAATGQVTISGGTLDLSVAAAFNLASLTLSGGTLAGSTPLTITTFAWSGGAVNRSGSIAIPASTGAMTVTGSTKYWYQATLNNSGTLTSSSTYYLYIYNGAVLNNLAGGMWNMTTDWGYYNGGGAGATINNAGTMTKSAGSGTKDIGVVFNNSGQVNVNSGTLRLANGGAHTGPFSVVSAATLHFSGGSHTFSAAAPISGAGALNVSNGSVTVGGDYNIAGGTSVTGGTLTLNGTLTATGALAVSSGTLDLSVAAATSLASLTLSGGTLAGSTALNITQFQWNGGTINRSGAINIPATTGVLNITGNTSKNWQQATLNNSGTVNSGSAYYMYFYDGAALNNLAGATWNMTTDWGYYHGGGAMPQLNNAGTMNRSASSGAKEIHISVNNSGQLNVNSGALRLNNGGTSSGTFNAVSGATLRLAGSHALTTSSTIAGAGTFELTSGTIDFSGAFTLTGPANVSGATFNVNSASAVTIGTLSLSSGTLGGSANVSISTFNWSAGSVNRTGSVDIPATTGTFNLTSGGAKYWQGGTLNNAGTVHSGSTYYLYFYNGAVLNNLAGATWNMTTDWGYYHGGGAMPQLNNAGTLNRTTGTGAKDISITVNNTAQINVNSGALRLNNGGTSSGTFNVANGTTLRFAGTHSLAGSSSLSGAGTFEVTSGTTTLGGTYALSGPLNVNGGTLNIDIASAVSIPTINLSSGTLGGSAALTVATFNWTSGSVSRSGAVNIPAAGGTLNLTTNGAKYWYQATLNNSGSVNSSSAYHTYFYNGAVVNNLAGASWTFTTDFGYHHGGGALPQFNNSGTLTRSGGSGTQNIGMSFSNAGTLDLQIGIVVFNNGYTQTGSGLLKTSIGGTTVSSQYARAAVTGTAVLGGGLNVALSNGFTPTVGDQFQIMTFGSRSGDFATKSGLTYPGGSMSYTANASNILLTGATATADLQIAKSASAATVATGNTFSYSIDVQNLGPSGAPNVTVTDSLPSGVSLNSASGTGWSCTSNGATPPTVTCTMASLAVGPAATITLSVTAPATPQSITNTASVTTTVGDPTVSNDSASAAVTVVSPTPGITVTSFADSGAGTLRQAITDANNAVCSAPCTIGFNLSPLQPIVLSSALPPITANMIIDATTQPGYGGTPLVFLDAGTCGCGIGLEVASTGSIIRGMVVRGFSVKGVRLTGGGGHTLELSTLGDSGSPNTYGVSVDSSNSVIQNNTIAHSANAGVVVLGATGARILGNAIHDNGTLGIDLDNDGATANEAGDGDSGANNWQNTPVISAAQATAGTLNVTLSLDSGAVTGTGSVRVELFEADGGGEGKSYLGGACFGGNTLTNQLVSVPATNIVNGDSVVATATSYSGTGCINVNDGTSEFSAAFPVVTCTAPSATITAPASACAGVAGYEASAPFVSGASYTWTITNGTIESGAGTDSIIFTAGPTGNVALQVVVNDGGCTTTGNTNVPINNPATPTITAGGATTFCSGGSVILTASAGASYLWVPTGETTQFITVTASGNYSVNVTDANGCTASSAATPVTVNPSPAPPVATNGGPYCEGATVQLFGSAVSGATYAWTGPNGFTSSAQNPTIANATLNDAGVYSLTVTVNGCPSTPSTTTVSVSATPAAPTATNGGPYCEGAAIQLNATTIAGAIYSWTGPNGFTSSAQSPVINNATAAHDGVYTVTAQVNGCPAPASSSTTVTVSPAVSATISAPAAVCANTSGTATVVPPPGSATYVWTIANGTIDSGQGTPSITFTTGTASPVSLGVTVSTAACSASDTEVVAVSSTTPTITASGPLTFCSSGSVTLAASAASTYQWYRDNAPLTGETGSTLVVTASGSYTVDASGGGCSGTSAPTVVNVNNPAVPTITASVLTNFCNGGSVTLTASGAASYQWFKDNAPINSASLATYIADASGSYHVTTTDANGCGASSAPIVVNEYAALALDITGPAATCPSSSITLDAGGGFATYAWSNGASSRTITVSPAADATYSVTVTDANGCSATDSHNVTVSASPAATITAPAAVCSNAPSNSAYVAAQPGATYNWTITGGAIVSGQGSETIVFSVGASGSVVLGVTVNAGNCSSNGTSTIPITAPPSVSITGPAAVCPNATFTLSVPNTYASYVWSNGATTPSIQLSQSAASATYSVTVTDASGCTATASHTVTTSAVNATVTAPGTVDADTAGYTASVPAQSGATYAWSIANGVITSATNANSITFTAGPSGNVTLNVGVTIGGCTNSGSASIAIAGVAPQEADLSVSKIGPSSVQAGGAITWTIVAANHGLMAVSATIADTLPAGVTVTGVNDAAWVCGKPAGGQLFCSGTLEPNASNTITVQATAPQSAGSITNSVSVTSPTDDPNPSNNSASATTAVTAAPPACSTATPSLLSPANAAIVTSPVAFSWSPVTGATSYEVWLVNGGTSLLGSTASTSLVLPVPSGTSNWFIVARLGTGCEPLISAQRSFTIEVADACAQHGSPQLTAPQGGSTVTSPVTFAWTPVPQAIGYRVSVSVDGTAAEVVGSTDGALTLIANVPAGAIRASVEALFGGCPAKPSPVVAFNVARPDPCAARAAATPLSPANNVTLDTSSVLFEWQPAANATGYRLWASIDGAAPAVLGNTSSTSLRENIARGEVIWWVEALYNGCASTESARFRFTIPARTNCGTARPESVFPANGSNLSNANVLFDWNPVADAIGYEVYLGVVNGTSTLIGSTGAGTTALAHLVPAGELEWTVVALVDRCPPRESQKARFTFTPAAACADNARAVLVSPLDGTTATSPAAFQWSAPAGATRYELFTVRGNDAPLLAASTIAPQAANIGLGTGALRWFVRTHFGQNCAPLDSAEFDLQILSTPVACSELGSPVISAPGEISSGVEFLLQWSSIAGADGYQLQIANNPAFTGADTIHTGATSHALTRTNNGNAPVAVYARARAIDNRCLPLPNIGAYGPTTAVFVLPAHGTLGTVPLSNPSVVTYTIVLGPELAGQTFTAVPSESWLTVTPAAGVVPAGGITLNVQADASALGVGTSLGAIHVNLSGNASRFAAHGTTSVTTISVNLVTPVTPAPKNTPPPDAMIIPAVANADGINAHFQSDVRVSNTSPQLIKYQLTFIPGGEAGIAAGRQTTFSIEPGRTIALDDVLKTWFGTGNANASGTLEIRPLTQTQSSTSSAPSGALANIVSFASSRTFNATPNGTYGQHIPAVPYANFLGKALDAAKKNVLSLQQIAQSARYRTNLGLVEGSGEPVTLLVKVFGSNGLQLTSFPVNLNGGQSAQLNSVLTQHGLTVDDGRIEVEVVSGNGKVTAYASVLDNITSDAVLVTPVTLSDAGNNKWVVPGVADLQSGFANWQTDMRVFNAGSAATEITASFVSQNGGAPRTAKFTLNAGEVKQLDKVLTTLFGVSGDGGALHLATAQPARLIATARTYNQTSQGTYGQFISAVTPQESVGVGSRPLQLLQVEESSRFRSNIGFAEVSGKPVKLEVTVVPPDAKFTARAEIELAANEFRQIGSLLSALGLGETYNARISVRAISGEGRATTYASVIDLQTNDPTYVPAQ